MISPDPSLSAPRSRSSEASSSAEKLAETLTPTLRAQYWRSKTTSSRAASTSGPAETAIKSAPHWEMAAHMWTFSSVESRDVSMTTLRVFPGQASRTARISLITSLQQPSLTMAGLTVISISSAPFETASPVSNALTAVVQQPPGNPTAAQIRSVPLA